MPLRRAIEGIGRRVVRCRLGCEGIVCSHKSGRIPRCLFLEAGHPNIRGAVVVGLNPGRASDEEREYYRDSPRYSAVVRWFERDGGKHGREHLYYERLRNLLRHFGLRGPIVWTELAKCEGADSGSKIPMQTFRTCTRLFLQQELEIPELRRWPLFGIGIEAYKALAYRFPERTLIGLPHPTGSRGHFAALFRGRNALGTPRSTVVAQYRSAIGRQASSAWLGTAHGR